MHHCVFHSIRYSDLRMTFYIFDAYFMRALHRVVIDSGRYYVCVCVTLAIITIFVARIELNVYETLFLVDCSNHRSACKCTPYSIRSSNERRAQWHFTIAIRAQILWNHYKSFG